MSDQEHAAGIVDGDHRDPGRRPLRQPTPALAQPVGEPRPDGREVIDSGWFALDSLPPGIVSFAAYRLKRVFAER